MTEFQHVLVAMVIFLFLWHIWLNRYFVSEKDSKQWKEIWHEIIRKYF